ncbi:hypothetical protein [Haloferula sp. BvORR071]|uniref:hypothetical protein n=1 Tax=Haloferula sp. BvORR071 TaxID=1396141 RepID=UPI00055931DC|nr:hypothetical protein [Haloferula sp. BvORR071]
MRNALLLAAASTCLLITGCDKPAATSEPGKGTPSLPDVPTAATVPVAAPLPVASHLGIATRVPADADFFLAGYHADEWVKKTIEEFLKSELFKDIESKPDAPKPEEVPLYVGDEAFVFVNGGGVQLQALTSGYRDVMAWSTGQFVAGALRELEKKERDPAETKAWADSMSADLLERILNAVEKDSQLQVPSVVMGWHPDAAKLDACSKKVAEGLDELLKKSPDAQPVSFEAQGASFKGFEFEGSKVFAKALEDARKAMAEDPKAKEMLDQIPQERIERVLAAMEKVHFTVASGSLDGRIFLYCGNGKEGFRLAASPEQSLAATDDLKWTNAYAEKKISGTVYFSEAMVRTVLPLLDSSVYFEEIAKKIGPPIRNERIFRELLSDLAQTEKQLAQRDASALSVIGVADEGFRLEFRGGWPDPALDYNAPLRMAEAADAKKPVLRAHWVQNRARNDLSWKSWETYGLIVDAALEEAKAHADSPLKKVPEGAIPELLSEIRALNRAYRDEFRAGIGDEVAIVADLKGEIPAVPGISEEVIRNNTMPRFVIVREVKDRALLDKAGATSAGVWSNLTGMASKYSGNEMPLILPQKLDSDDLTTWYFPAPFIGGDFVPGVSLNDKLWMVGTSRELASGMAKALATPASGSESGMLVEIDMAPYWDWMQELVKRNGLNADQLLEEAPEEMKKLTKPEDVEKALESMRKMKGLSYRKWLEQGKPRASLHVRYAN